MSLIERAVRKIGDDPSLPQRRPHTVADEHTSTPRDAAAADAAPPAAPSTLRPAFAIPDAAPAERGAPIKPTDPVEPARIALTALRTRGFITPDSPATPLSQQFRVIKRPLIRNAVGRGATPVRNGRRIMVTSAFPGEGKSFCAINLAMSIAAERDQTVLLVDADVARPTILQELGLPDGPGLMDWLTDGAPDPAELVLQTNVDRLAILPAGRVHSQATEYLASTAMAQLLEHLSSRFPDRIMVFDSPPLLATTEARVLASYMGQIVMVVEAGRTSRESVKEAVESIEGCEVVGMLLNKVPGSAGGGYYGYDGYGYGAD